MTDSASTVENERLSNQDDRGIWVDMVQLFVSPTKAFRSIAENPKWLLPFILVVVASVAFEASIGETRMADLKRQVMSNPDYSEKDVQTRLDNIQAQRTTSIFSMRTGLGILLLTAFEFAKLIGLSVAIRLSLFLFTSTVDFRSVLSLCALSALVAIPETMVKIPLILAKGTTRVWTGSAAFLPASLEGSILFGLSEELDVFTIWQVLLIGLGLHVIARISMTKAYITIGYLWGLWIVANVMFGGLIRIT
jgi:hypothetical protein